MDFHSMIGLGVAGNFTGHLEQAVISIGATRYTEFGEKTFLQNGDEVFVVLYNENIYDKPDITKILNT